MPAVGTRADSLRLKVDSTEIEQLARIGTIPGVVVERAAARNGPGYGRLRSTILGRHLRWQAPGSTSFGQPIDVSLGGDFLVEDGDDPNKFLRLTVTLCHLFGPTESRVLLGDLYENEVGHDDVLADEAAAGDVTIYSITLENANNVVLSHLKAWLDAATENLEISDDQISWVAPTSEAAALKLPDLGAGASDVLYLRRTIGAGTDCDPDVLTHLHFSFCAL
jgi:hypothetical protein